jgi:hypothetical protein
MAVKRPWVLPNDVKSYTSHKEVSERSDEKLTFDIARAEMKIIHITNNKFAEYDEIPEPVKMAVILVAEAYAKNDIEAAKKKIKSESFDDYSYTAGTISLDSLDLEELLADYIITDGIGKTVMRLRIL